MLAKLDMPKGKIVSGEFGYTFGNANGDFGKAADGNPIRLAYGTNGIDWLKKEMEEVATDIAHLESAGAYKYGRNPNSQVLGKLKDYQKNLNETFLSALTVQLQTTTTELNVYHKMVKLDSIPSFIRQISQMALIKRALVT